MAYLLFPGRHIVNTRFQESYLLRVLQMPPEKLAYHVQPQAAARTDLDTVIFAITSSNQQNSRYNPLSFHVRAVGVDRFARLFRDSLGVSCRIAGIPHYGETDRFARNTVREIQEQTEGELTLTPDNTVVLCSTPEVIEQYARLGFGVLPCELGEPAKPSTPVLLTRRVAELGVAWAQDPMLRSELAPTTFSLWHDFPEIPSRIARMYRDPLLNDQGSLTDTRNYAVYAFAMSNPAAIEFKYRDVQGAIVPGRIVDEGCADGALLVPIARDFPDSDLIGIEITGEFMAQCAERQRRGDFGGTYTHFHQRNLMDEIFEPDSIDTTLCNSTVHELWSYVAQADTVRPYFARKFRQTRPGGRIIIRDVVGPEDMHREVYLWCNDTDGSNANVSRACDSPASLQSHLDQLSTHARFLRFAQDFLAQMRAGGHRSADTQVTFREESIQGRRYFVTSLKNAAEFLLKKDYTDSWMSELKEEFTFWSYAQWKAALAEAGFVVLENPNDPSRGSRAYANAWIVDNRFKGKVELFTRSPAGLLPLEYPVTNQVLVAEKPRAARFA